MGIKRRLFQLGIGRPGPRQAVEWEIEHHLAELTEALVEEGWDPESARREAEERFETWSATAPAWPGWRGVAVSRRGGGVDWRPFSRIFVCHRLHRSGGGGKKRRPPGGPGPGGGRRVPGGHGAEAPGRTLGGP